MPFRYIRMVYEALREEERIKLNKYLKEHPGIKDEKLRVVSGALAGKGSYQYKYAKDVEPFDLRNWKWVEVKSKDGFDCVISLNMLETDPRTQNTHSLYDRIGLICVSQPKELVHTSMELPLSEEDMDQIAQLVLEQYKIFCEKKAK